MDVNMKHVVTHRLRSSKTATTTSRISATPATAPITMVELFWICDSAVQIKRKQNKFSDSIDELKRFYGD